MWKEQAVPATVIDVDNSAGVRKVDGTLNDSLCRVRYPGEDATSRRKSLLCCVIMSHNAISNELITQVRSDSTTVL